VVVAQDPAADAPDHRAAPMDDRLEDGLLPPVHEAIQELPVRESPHHPHGEEGLEVTGHLIHPALLLHGASSAGLARPLPAYYPVEPVLIHFFPAA
jgi:hypothetical protein